jgi:hypothetical protein
LLSHALSPKFGIAGQLARFALGASGHFVHHPHHSIFIHKPTSVDSTSASSMLFSLAAKAIAV